jgi:hypothetical protein
LHSSEQYSLLHMRHEYSHIAGLSHMQHFGQVKVNYLFKAIH